MNNFEIKTCLKKYCKEELDLSNDILLNGMTTNLQHAKKNDVAFYKITGDPGALLKFREREASATYGLLIINLSLPDLNKKNIVAIDDKNFYSVQKILADIIYPYPSHIKLSGVTGTNGKTTVVNLSAQIAGQLGKKAISVGTLGIKNQKNEILEKDLESTTPSFIEFRRILFTHAQNIDAVFLEVSSHGLDQNRLSDINLDVAGWTNLTQDHLDYHKEMESYFKAKLKIITDKLKKNGRCFLPIGEENLLKKINSFSDKAQLCDPIDFKNIKNLPPFFRSSFNEKNLQLALQLNGFLFEKNQEAIKLSSIKLETIIAPEGRLNIIPFKDNYIVIDYAHTPDALENIAKALKKDFADKKLTIVFGCGGNRDRKKRPIMGEIAQKYGDRVVVTSDNPRDEVPEDIIAEIMAGLSERKNITVEVDRGLAIQKALTSASQEIILIAGKGHETYQEIKGTKHPFSDYDEVKRWNQ